VIARGLTTIYRIWAGAIGSALFLFAEVLAIKNGLDVRWIVMRLIIIAVGRKRWPWRRDILPVAGGLLFLTRFLRIPRLATMLRCAIWWFFSSFPCYPDPPARTWRRPLHSCGVASPEAPAPDRESLPASIPQFIRVGPHPRRLDGALGASNSSASFRNCTEAFDTARPLQSHEQAKVSDAILTESPTDARPERTECRTRPCGRRNEAA
jgi:hypothetical protein